MTEHHLWGETRPADHGRDPMLRAGDRDRDSVAEHLRTQHAEGRLDIDELQERIDRCYDAKTLGQLEQLLLDLPRESSAQERPEWLLGLWRPRREGAASSLTQARTDDANHMTAAAARARGAD